MTSIQLEHIPSLLSHSNILALKEYFNQQPEELYDLFAHFVNNEEWTRENPALCFKAVSLLDANELKSEQYQKILRVIAASEFFIEENSYVLQDVLSNAIRSNNWDYVFNLIELGTPTDYRLGEENSLLHIACTHSMSAEAIKLIELGAGVDEINEADETPLHLATIHGLVSVCQKLLEAGANPLCEDVELHTPLYYACREKNSDLLQLFENYYHHTEWQCHLALQYVELKQWEEAKEAIEKAPSPTCLLINAVKHPLLLNFLMLEYREMIDGNREWIRTLSTGLSLDEKLSMLILLSPNDIQKTLQEVPKTTIDEWMERSVIVEEDSDSQVFNTIRRGLIEVDENWNQPEIISGSFDANIVRFLGRIPLVILSALAMSEDHCEILIRCLSLCNEDQLTVIIPHIPLEDFLSYVEDLPPERQGDILKFANDPQKMKYLDALPLPFDANLRSWFLVDKEKVERLMDPNHKNEHQRKKNLKGLIEIIDKYKNRLPVSIARESRALETIKNALLDYCPNQAIHDQVEKKIKPWKNKIHLVEKRLKHIASVIEKDPLYHEVVEMKKKEPPGEFLCIITKEVMVEPVEAHGHSFEKNAISQWLEGNSNCPLCRKEVSLSDFVEDEELLKKIEAWKLSLE